MVLFFVFVWCLVYVWLSNALSWTFPRIFDGLVLSDFPCHYALKTKKDFNILAHDILDAEFHTFMISQESHYYQAFYDFLEEREG